MDITHSYDGLGLEYKKSRQGIPGFASFVVFSVSLKTLRHGLPVTIVELGVGSGQQTEFIEKELESKGIYQYRVLAFDKSYQSYPGEQPGQLNILKERIANGELSDKIVPIHYDFDGNILPIKSGSVYFSYMAHVFHHLNHKQEVFDEISRVTLKDGKHFILGVTIEDLENHPLNKYFPMKYKYDSIRYPTIEQLQGFFKSAGFTYEQPFLLGKHFERPVDRSFLESIENTTLDSALHIIKDDDPSGFQKGILSVKKEVEQAEKSGKYKTYFTDIIKVFWGTKN